MSTFSKPISILCLATLCIAETALAQLPSIPGVTPGKAAPPVTASPPADPRAVVTAQISETMRLRDEAIKRAESGSGDSIEEARLLEQLALQLRERRRFLEESDTLKRSPRAPDETPLMREFTGPGPFPLTRIDALREESDNNRERVQALQARLQTLDIEATVHLEQKRRAEENVRQARDKLARHGNQSTGEQRAVELAALRQRIADAELASLTSEKERIELELGLEKNRSAAYRELLARVMPTQRFTQEELDAVRATLKANQEKLSAEIERLNATSARREHERERLLGSTSPDNNERFQILLAESETAQLALQVVTSLETLERVSSDVWEGRYYAMNGEDAKRRAYALAMLKKVHNALNGSQRLSSKRLEDARSAVRAVVLKLDGMSETAPGRKQQQALLATLQKRVTILERGEQAAVRLRNQIGRWLVDLNADKDEARLADPGKILKDWAHLIWNYELFSVEDITEVDGKKLTVSYGITVRKSVGAFLLFVLGYGLISFISRHLQSLLVRRLGVGEHVAQVIRRWLMIVCAVVLLIIVLNLARIPLTVFAFLGGALAIGVGFGTQTIIKNFISGIIILFERKIRVGDIIQLGNMTGQVTAVDLRASTVRGFDGVEALVPNSTFLETQVINWTYSNPRIRRVVKVGVAYGTDPRTAAGLIAGCARAHVHVLSEPAPEVFLEDFGDSALLLALYFWVELGPSVSGTRVDSELRFAIHQALEVAGIAIPYPQREVHFNTSQPVRVELAQPESTNRP